MIEFYVTMRNKLLILLFCFTSSLIFGQTQKAFIKAADEAYTKKNYYGALVWYKEALEFNKRDTTLRLKYADAAREFEAYDIAAENYKLLVDSLAPGSYPEAKFHLGEMYQRLGKFNESKATFQSYIEKHGDSDEKMKMKAEKKLETLDYAIKMSENIDKSADITQMEMEVNTPYSEFGAIKKDSTLYFTTMRYIENNPEELPAKSISKLHTLKDETNSVIEQEINNTDSLVAHTTFSLDGKTLYYTLCEYINDEDVRCDIYTRPILENDEFGAAKKLASPINIDSVTTTHPHITFDSILNSEILYFVSDRDGGKGQLDIYFTTVKDGEFGKIINLEAINTEDNDASPFYHTATNTLYFSTDGRMTIGGYDIFKAPRDGFGWKEPTALMVPTNSSYHDLYYTLNEEGNEAYFSSNREGAMYIDEAQKACCFDIFNVKYDEVILELNATVFDDLTKEELNGATLTLIDNESGDTINSLTNIDGNDFYFKLKRDMDYTLIAEREYYNSQRIPITTKGISESTNIKKEIYLKTDRTQLEILTFNKRTELPLNGVEITITNLTTNEIDTVALNKNGNKFHFYIEPGYKYQVEAAKFGFSNEIEIVDLSEMDEPEFIQKKMYLDVFDIEDYMPVTIYFENDFPDPRSKSTLTDKIYGNLFADYIRNKDKYIDNHIKRLPNEEKETAQSNLDNFFEGEVVGGYDKLKRFMRALKIELELGRNLEIAIKGYASPIADTKYNLALGQRRVSSVKNEILNYEGGVFREYVENGSLILTDISYGEETSPPDVSDKTVDKSKSVYSVAASKERRVQIIKITDQ